MHIPDGFLGPRTWLPAAAVCGVTLPFALRRLQSNLQATTVPALGVTTACSFGLMLIAIPLPLGGGTIHATGVALLAIRFGVPTAYLALSLVLALQALLLGDGGVTSLPVSVLCLGLGGPLSAVAAYKLLHRVDERVARFAAGWLGVVVPALLTGLALGLQPVIAVDSLGEPLFFPFGWRTVLPALVVPHMVVGVLEGVLTVIGLGLWRADQS